MRDASAFRFYYCTSGVTNNEKKESSKLLLTINVAAIDRFSLRSFPVLVSKMIETDGYNLFRLYRTNLGKLFRRRRSLASHLESCVNSNSRV